MQQTISSYQQQGLDFINKHELEFRAVLIGDDCPLFCADAEQGKDMDKVTVFPRKSHIHGKHYRCTISRKGKGHFSVDFWNSYADEEYRALGDKKYQFGETFIKYSKGRPQLPQAYDVLTCLQKSDVGTFEDFCSEFGYDADSRKAEQVYNAVVKEWRKVRAFFTDAEIAELQDIQ
jgi:hypothetical protein